MAGFDDADYTDKCKGVEVSSFDDIFAEYVC